MVDDRTLTAARINKSAYVLFQALRQPCALEDLVLIQAVSAKCSASEAFAPVAKLLEDAARLGWIEAHDVEMAP